MSNQVVVLRDFFHDEINGHRTRRRPERIGIGRRIGRKGNGHRSRPRVATHVEGVISVAYLGEVENLTVGHVQVGLGKTSNRNG